MKFLKVSLLLVLTIFGISCAETPAQEEKSEPITSVEIEKPLKLTKQDMNLALKLIETKSLELTLLPSGSKAKCQKMQCEFTFPNRETKVFINHDKSRSFDLKLTHLKVTFTKDQIKKFIDGKTDDSSHYISGTSIEVIGARDLNAAFTAVLESLTKSIFDPAP